MPGADADDLLALFRRALSGSPAAWNDLFARLRQYVHAEVRKALGSDVPGGPEYSDVVQSVLRRVWEHVEGRFPADPEHADLRRFLAWVAVIARNRSRDRRDEWNRRRPAAGGSAVKAVADRRDEEAAARRDLIAAELAAALAALPERKRRVVELFWFERLSDAEIGARLGCSGGAAKVLRCRALQALRTPRLRALLEDGHAGR
jgi:RNA polymerase sigma-70 factor (ECF subfamily)